MTDTVLVVDDSLTVRMDLVRALEADGFRAIPCAGIAEARNALVVHAVDVVILDVVLPDGDGVDFLGELRASPRYSDVVVLMLSTESEVADRLRGLRTGADDYVGKPYDLRYVLARTRQLLSGGATLAHDTTTVLVIEDSLTFRREVTQALEGAGYEVIAAETGEDGLRAAEDRRPDIVLVDWKLPGIDGPTVIRRIRLDPALRRLPCLLLTASDDRSAELQALDAGADAFVRKGDITLVLAKLAAALRGVSAPTEDPAGLRGPKRILAVDDSRTYLETIAASLSGEGYEVILARSGEEACELLASQPVDCILLDLMMPGIGGRDTCRRIKSAPVLQNIPIIMLTAVDDTSATIECLAAGADDFIHKASEFEVLKARVRAQIRRKLFEDENRRIRDELVRAELDATEARAAAELVETRGALIGELERKNEELLAFSSSVSHDLRNPLQALLGFGQILREDYADKLDANGTYYVTQICNAGQRMAEIIDDLLQLSHVNGVELTLGPVDLSAMATTSLEDLRGREPGRIVITDIAEGAIVHADARLMRVLMDNLIGNAWKYSSKTDAAVIEFGWWSDDEASTCFVRDNGAGFDMRHAAALFMPFRRLHEQDDFPGTGIGLATVHRVIDRHGGRIWAESAVNRGATFYFAIPAAHTAEAPAGEHVGAGHP